MNQDIKNTIKFIWDSDLNETIKNKMVDVSKFPNLASGIPDNFLYLSEIISEEDIDQVGENYLASTSEYNIDPIMIAYGNQTICIGHAQNNFGKIYYFDFDFGGFNLGCTLQEFINGLLASDNKL